MHLATSCDAVSKAIPRSVCGCEGVLPNTSGYAEEHKSRALIGFVRAHDHCPNWGVHPARTAAAPFWPKGTTTMGHSFTWKAAGSGAWNTPTNWFHPTTTAEATTVPGAADPGIDGAGTGIITVWAGKRSRPDGEWHSRRARGRSRHRHIRCGDPARKHSRGRDDDEQHHTNGECRCGYGDNRVTVSRPWLVVAEHQPGHCGDRRRRRIVRGLSR